MDDFDFGLAYRPGDDREPGLDRGGAKALAPLVEAVGQRAERPAKPKIDLSAFRGQFEAPDEGISLADTGLREAVVKLREQTADRELRELLDKAERALRAGRFDEAWTHAGAALKIGPASVPALLIGAKCRHALDDHESALALLATARRYSRSAAEVTAVARMRGLCETGLVRAVTVQADHLFGAEQHSAAIRYVQQKVDRHPEIMELRYVLGGVLFRAGEYRRAREVVEALLGTGQADGIEVITQLHRAILAELGAPVMERARRCLRAGKPRAAIQQLTEFHDTVRTHPQYKGAWAYAHERCGTSRNMSVRERWRVRSTGTSLAADDLQETLIWLLKEEFTAGLNAFVKDDLVAVGSHCTRAEKFDDRSGVIAFLHAMAELATVMKLDEVDLTTLAEADRRLSSAARLADRAAADRVFNPVVALLMARISEARAEMDLISCFSRFNALMEPFVHGRRPTATEWRHLQAKLRSIRSSAYDCEGQHPAGSPARARLDELLIAINRLM
ncbi:hypothetical protein D5S17_21075 [Pseudonocardiaceae bacterium YIM PH 21723]|nr:hypothetical protein D5S17_21075 [Pseudonocardiaceae bacterium YIM PH 21723]